MNIIEKELSEQTQAGAPDYDPDAAWNRLLKRVKGVDTMATPLDMSWALKEDSPTQITRALGSVAVRSRAISDTSGLTVSRDAGYDEAMLAQTTRIADGVESIVQLLGGKPKAVVAALQVFSSTEAEEEEEEQEQEEEEEQEAPQASV